MSTTFIFRLVWLLTGSLELLAGCASSRQPGIDWQRAVVKADTCRVLDPARQRPIPLVTYAPVPSTPRPQQLKLALLKHSYGGRNTDYSFLAKNLVAHGYYVVSLQHELPGDEPIATTGNLLETRRPNWERARQNILFVLREVKHAHPELNCRQLLLMGHSNGGDIAALFVQKYPALVAQLITFDNRRMPLPRTRRPRVLSLRSSDQPADAGVLLPAAEQRRLGMEIIRLPTTLHNDMWDGATLAQQQEINALISHFLAP